jgi:hypothetical protein
MKKTYPMTQEQYDMLLTLWLASKSVSDRAEGNLDIAEQSYEEIISYFKIKVEKLRRIKVEKENLYRTVGVSERVIRENIEVNINPNKFELNFDLSDDFKE